MIWKPSRLPRPFIFPSRSLESLPPTCCLLKSLQRENFGLKVDLLFLSFCAISHKLDMGKLFIYLLFVYTLKASENHRYLRSWISGESMRVELVDSDALLSSEANSPQRVWTSFHWAYCLWGRADQLRNGGGSSGDDLAGPSLWTVWTLYEFGLENVFVGEGKLNEKRDDHMVVTNLWLLILTDLS